MAHPPSQTPDEARRKSRAERQGRVGILRNLNTAPAPPPRKAALMGKWPRLRSSRRPTIAQAQPASTPPPDAGGAIVVETGEGVRINLARLESSIATAPKPAPRRSAYAATFRHDLPANSKPARAAAPPQPFPPEIAPAEPAPQAPPPERAPFRAGGLGGASIAVLAMFAVALWLIGGR
jgi:hypothetical protein